MILHNKGEVYMPEHGHHILAMTHARVLILKQFINFVTLE